MAELSGRWTIRAIENEAGWPQGILIQGSAVHDGIHQMTVGDMLEHVEGEAFSVTPQHFNQNVGDWFESLENSRFAFDPQIGLTLTIFADDNPPLGDGDFNDLVVLCTPEDEELVSPQAGIPPLDLTIPEQMVIFR